MADPPDFADPTDPAFPTDPALPTDPIVPTDPAVPAGLARGSASPPGKDAGGRKGAAKPRRTLWPVQGRGEEQVYVSFASHPPAQDQSQAPAQAPAQGEPRPLEGPPDKEEGGAPAGAEGETPSAADLAEASHFVQGLEDAGHLTRQPGPLPEGVTHSIETDEEGRKRLVRKRFSAI